VTLTLYENCIVRLLLRFFLLGAVLGMGLTPAENTTPRPAPELRFRLPKEGEQSLTQYRGKVVALEFILTTCVHCQAASAVMTKLQNEYGSRGFQALDLAINGLDEGRDEKAADALVEKFATDFHVGFPVGWVPRERMSSFLGVSLMERMVVPQLVLIDRKGMIHYQTPPLGDENSMQENTIRQRIEELLALNNSPTARPTKHKTAASH
jgi:thiol-disulfide isomerase/thioredoxin